MKRLVSFCVLLAVLAACGTTSGRPAPEDSPNAGTSSAPSSKTLTQQELQDTVLPVTLMPNGYKVDPENDGVESEETYCGYQQPHKASAYAERAFTKRAAFASQIVLITVRQFDSAQQAKESFEALEKALGTCKTDVMNGERVTLTRLPAPALGQGSLGVNASLGAFSAPQFFTVSGRTLIGVGGTGIGGPSMDVLTEVLRDQVSRYERRAG
jgi:hypothetical protein